MAIHKKNVEILRLAMYLKHSRTSMMDFFYSLNIFAKKLHCRCSTRFWTSGLDGSGDKELILEDYTFTIWNHFEDLPHTHGILKFHKYIVWQDHVLYDSALSDHKSSNNFGFFNDTHKETLCFIQISTRMAGWLLLTFLRCLHNHLKVY